MRVKICGIKDVETALVCEEYGADAIGFIFTTKSKRYIDPDDALEISFELGPLISRVGVFVDLPIMEVYQIARKLRLDAVQLHGKESADYAAELSLEFKIIKAFSFTKNLNLDDLYDYPADSILLDGIKPGSGKAFSWQDAKELADFPNLILAGGLNPDNVAEAIKTLAPYAVDVSSGVEAKDASKDHKKIIEFIKNAKAFDF